MLDNSSNLIWTDAPLWIGHDEHSECGYVHHLNVSDQCAFVNATESCHVSEGIIDYTVFIYCTFRANLISLAIVLLAAWLFVLFVTLGIAADMFFCPALEVMAKTMRMSDNIAGVTLLAFGNGAPDVFSAISAVANMKNNDVGMVFGALLGAGAFLTTVVAGSVCLVGPFHVMERPFLRDIIFYLVTVFLTFAVTWDGKITLAETLMYFIAYFIYVLVVVIGRIVYQWQKRRAAALHALSSSEEQVATEQEEEVVDRAILRSGSSDNGDSASNDESTPLLAVPGSVVRARRSVFSSLLLALFPIDVEQWKKNSYFGKFIQIIKAPLLFLIKLTTPVVDYSLEPDHNWCKPLQILHCIITPVFVIFAATDEIALLKVGGVFYVWLFFLIGGCILAAVVYFTSTCEHPPVYHPVFAFAGFFAAVMWIKMIANEIVNILQTFGLVFHVSNAILGLTFLAWGNSIGDFIADVAMARRGFPRTGISACFGGPLFNTLLGIGIPFTRKIMTEGHPVTIQLSSIQVVLFSGVGFSLIFSMLVVPLMRFRLTPFYGIFLIFLYMIFLTIALLVEMHVIHLLV